MSGGKNKILITGAAGFIGSALGVELLKDEKNIVVGLDNLNDYYSTSLKEARLQRLKSKDNFEFIKVDITDDDKIKKVFDKFRPQIVVHLAGWAGVRKSTDEPRKYAEANIMGFLNILEACKEYKVEHLIYASSSSVYGQTDAVPFCENNKTDNPISVYAATKKCDEVLAHAYTKLHGLKTTGLRFFTVYGPMGRPDMAYYDFANRMRNGKTIQIFNYGKMRRDFVYIDDLVEGLKKVVKQSPKEDYNIYNIGKGAPDTIGDFVETLWGEMKKKGLLPEGYDLREKLEFTGIQKGDVTETFADTTKLEKDFGFRPRTNIKEGLERFVEWYSLYEGREE